MERTIVTVADPTASWSSRVLAELSRAAAKPARFARDAVRLIAPARSPMQRCHGILSREDVLANS